MNQFRYYLIGSSFQSWSDHKPLIPLYNNHQTAASKRIARHRDQTQDLNYTMNHLPGKENPCDYGSRHPLPIEHLQESDKSKMGLDVGDEIYVRNISTENSPYAITTDDIKRAASNDATYTQLAKCISEGRSGDREIKKAGCHRIWQELCVIDNVIYKADKIIIPDGELFPGSGNIHSWILDVAHEGHQGVSAMKRYLRTLAWFPGMDKAIETRVSECLACQASTKTHHRDPLIPSTPPLLPWEKLSADHWGPLPDGKYLLVVIDELSRYPEVAVVSGTSAEANIPALDEIFSRHGFCNRLKTDGGPPFNGNENHSLQQYFKWAGVRHMTTVSAEDPEANGLAESFMKHCVKIYHTATIERKNPTAELNKHLRIYRATPHPTTGKPPALLLFGRNIKTRICTANSLLITENRQNDIREARETEINKKQKQKFYKDDISYAKPHDIQTGDKLLLAQKKTKVKPPYDPRPYRATEVIGHQITATRGDKTVTRDAQKWKKILTRPSHDYNKTRLQHTQNIEDQDEPIGFYKDTELRGDINEPAVGAHINERVGVDRNNAAHDYQRDAAAHLEDEDERLMPRLYPQRMRVRPDYYVAHIDSQEERESYRARRTIRNLNKIRQLTSRKIAIQNVNFPEHHK